MPKICEQCGKPIHKREVVGRSPCYQYYPDKYREATERLSDSADRAYRRVLDHMWLHCSPPYVIENTEACLRLASRLSGSRFTKIWAEIQNQYHPLLKTRGKRLISNGLRKEYVKQKKTRMQRRKAAYVKHGFCICKFCAGVSHCTPSPTPSLTPTPSIKDVNPEPKPLLTPSKEPAGWQTGDLAILQHQFPSDLFQWFYSDGLRLAGLKKYESYFVLAMYWQIKGKFPGKRVDETGRLMFGALKKYTPADALLDKAKRTFSRARAKSKAGGKELGDIMKAASKGGA